MKPGAWMRHSTPDLDFLVKLYLNEVENVNIDCFYDRIRHIRKEIPHPCIYMNEVMGLWEHVFNYDEPYLKHLWSEHGFEKIKRSKFCERNVPELNGLDSHSVTPWVQDKFTLILEGRKPTT
jgi:predicted SAM-dependent methyltransferase